MKFRSFVAARVPLQEADLLGAPTGGGSSPPSEGSPQDDLCPKKSLPGADRHQQPASSEHGREIGQSHEQMRKVLALAVQLGKSLAGLPHPWNKQFHSFKQPVGALVARLQEVT